MMAQPATEVSGGWWLTSLILPPRCTKDAGVNIKTDVEMLAFALLLVRRVLLRCWLL